MAKKLVWNLKAEKADIRCPYIETRKGKRKFGQKCGWILMKRNSAGEAAGEVVCKECKAKYEVINNTLIYLGPYSR